MQVPRFIHNLNQTAESDVSQWVDNHLWEKTQTGDGVDCEDEAFFSIDENPDLIRTELMSQRAPNLEVLRAQLQAEMEASRTQREQARAACHSGGRVPPHQGIRLVEAWEDDEFSEEEDAEWDFQGIAPATETPVAQGQCHRVNLVDLIREDVQPNPIAGAQDLAVTGHISVQVVQDVPPSWSLVRRIASFWQWMRVRAGW